MERNFMKMLRTKWGEQKFVCIGLDPDYHMIPPAFLLHRRCVEKSFEENIKLFNETIIDSTKDIACAYKPNSAFYEMYGETGIDILTHTVAYIKEKAPDVPIILDSKRADIGNTNVGYARFAFEGIAGLNVDAITVHPYLGSEAMKPFLHYKNKGIIVLCKTSNPGAGEFQDLLVLVDDTTIPFYQYVAGMVKHTWNYNENCLLVAGATYPEEIAHIRHIVGDMPLLIPGIGTQGGDLEKTLEAGLDSEGNGVIINSSSGIIYASDPRAAAMKLHADIRNRRNKILEYRLANAS